MTLIKICGITNLDDALAAVGAGADALGLNFYQKSPRYISPEAARKIVDELPDSVKIVGVFVNETVDGILEIVEIAGLDAIQLHGDEGPSFVTSLHRSSDKEIIRAIRVSPDLELEEIKTSGTDAILLDSYSTDEYGGSGKRFDWKIAQRVRAMVGFLYLAGGISTDNVKEAIRKVGPDAIDACSSVESSPGKKDHEKLLRFIAEVKRYG